MSLRKHWRFLAGLALGVAAAAVVPGGAMRRLLVGADGLFVFYLLTTWLDGRRLSPADLRRHASEEDEGALVIVMLAVAAVAASVVAIFDVLAGGGGGRWLQIAALISVPLGWIMLHTLFALRYAHLWYVPGDALTPARDDEPPKVGGLDFPDCDEPGLIEFLYYAFTIGMTAQTSDTAVTTSEMRRLTLWHAGISFLYNTVLIALSVNAAMTAAGAGGG